MGPFKKLLVMIPDRRVRRIAAFFAVVILSVLLTKTVEMVLSRDTLSGLHKIQDRWIATTEKMTPLALAGGYWDDIQAVSSGDWTYEAPKPVRPDPAIAEQQQKRLACENAELKQSLDSSQCLDILTRYHLSGVACVTGGSQPGCSDYLACSAQHPTSILPPPECAGVSNFPNFDLVLKPGPPEKPKTAPWPPFIPVVALMHEATRIASGELTGAIFALLQAGMGLLVLIALTYSGEKKQFGFDNLLANVIFVPLAVVGLGSAVAFALKWLMLGAMYLLRDITSLAEIAAGLTGVGGICWACVAEIAKKGAEHAVVG